MAVASAQTKVPPKIAYGEVPVWDWEHSRLHNTLRYNGRNVYKEDDGEQDVVLANEIMIRDKINAKWSSRRAAYHELARKTVANLTNASIPISELLGALKKVLDLHFITDEAIVDVLNRWDANHDGALDWHEFSAAVRSETSNEELETSFGNTSPHTKQQQDGDARINYLLTILRRKITEGWMTLHKAYLAFSGDHSGSITRENWKRMFTGNNIPMGTILSDDEIEALRQQFDRNNNGVVSYQEFADEVQSTGAYRRGSSFASTHDGRRLHQMGPVVQSPARVVSPARQH
jgi:centrin-3